jgi:hypothetical protein
MTPLSKEQLLVELDSQIAAAQRQLQQLQSARAALAGTEFVLGAERKFVSDLGVEIIAKNNTLQKLKRTKGDKTEIARLEKELAEMREQLKRQKAEERARRRSL